jgi:hypothetical protein
LVVIDFDVPAGDAAPYPRASDHDYSFRCRIAQSGQRFVIWISIAHAR